MTTQAQQPGAPSPAPAPAPTPGTPEYNDAMVALFDKHQGRASVEGVEAPQPNQQQPQDKPAPPKRPDDVPEKFWDAEKGEVNVEALLKSYRELERARSQQPAQKPADGQQPSGEQKPDGEKPADGQQPVTPFAGVDFNALGDEIGRDGKLSDASIEALTKAGLPREIVDAYVRGAIAEARLRTMDMHAYVGGEQAYKELLAWADKHLSESEKDHLSEQAAGDNWRIALDSLRFRKSQFDAQNPDLIRGAAPAGSVAAFRSEAELVRAMQDPRYQTDPAYRAEVANRLRVSGKLARI